MNNFARFSADEAVYGIPTGALMNKGIWLSGAITASKKVHSDLEGNCLNLPTMLRFSV